MKTTKNRLVRKRCLCAALAATLLLLCACQAGTDAGSATSQTAPMSTEAPVSTEPAQPAELPTFEIGDSWESIPTLKYCQTENAPTLYDPAITALPVYAVDPKHDNLGSTEYNEAQLRTIMDKVVQTLGVHCTGDYYPEQHAFATGEDLSLVNLGATTDVGSIVVTVQGDVYFQFNESLKIAQVRELLKLPETSYVYSFDNSVLRLIPALEDPMEQLLVWNFGGIYLYCDSYDLDNTNVYMIVWHQDLDAADWNDCSRDWSVCLGNYPLITLDEARTYARNGYYFPGRYYDDLYFSGKVTEELLASAELVYSDFSLYRTEKITGMRIPYYRFRYNDFSNDCICVPAVRPEYISDWEPGDEPLENAYPKLVKLNDDYYEVQGTDRAVEALQYLGIPDQDEIRADVDGDGKNELIYLFNGPSPDQHTVGIAVYGLFDGTPELETSEILLLDGYQARLELDGREGIVRFVLDPGSTAPEGATGVALKLTVEKECIQLTGGMLPEGCERNWLPSPTEEAISDLERDLNGEYFTELRVNNRTFFTNGCFRIWQHGDEILRRDLSTKETETLFTLAHDEEIETVLLGVSDNRLYFGWNEVEDWWGENVYSVNYRNEDRTDIGNALGHSFANGLLALETFRTDVRPVTLQVFDSSDRKVVQYKVCWCSAFVDGSLYFVYMPELQEYGKLEGVPAELRDRDVTLSYAVCRVDPDGSVTELGAIQRNYPNGWNMESAWINPETRTISFDYTGICYDLFTLTLKTDELPEDLHELVEDSISVQGAYTDACDNLCDYSYTLPRLKLDNEEAQAINAEIDEKYGAYVRQVQSRKDGDVSLEYPEISYEAAVWDDVVTIVISQYYSYDYVSYDVYCYDCTVKRRLDTPALLEKLGISQERFLEACRTTFRERYEKNTAAMPEEERAQYEREFPEMLPDSEKFVNLELQAYPGEDGTLMTVAGITTWVGAAYYYHLIPVLDIQN